MHSSNSEMWIHARALIKRGWLPTPRHARGGRHANTNTRRGRNVAARVAN